MAASINRLMVDEGPKEMYSFGFRQLIEDHLPELKDSDQSEYIDVSAASAWRHQGDLYALLTEYDIPRQHHWIIMRVNDMDSPLEYQGEHRILIPSQNMVRRLFRIHRASNKLSESRSKKST